MNDDQKAFQHYKARMNIFEKIAYKTKAARWYRNGTFFDMSLHWWHPVTWLMVIFLIVIAIPVMMTTQASLKDFKEELIAVLTVDKFFKENPEKLRWFKEEK